MADNVRKTAELLDHIDSTVELYISLTEDAISAGKVNPVRRRFYGNSIYHMMAGLVSININENDKEILCGLFSKYEFDGDTARKTVTDMMEKYLQL